MVIAVTTPITLMKRKKEKKNTVMANPITRKIYQINYPGHIYFKVPSWRLYKVLYL